MDRRAAARRACLAYLRIAAVYSGSVAVQPRFSCAEHRHSQQLAPLADSAEPGRPSARSSGREKLRPGGGGDPAFPQTLLHFGSIIQLVAFQFQLDRGERIPRQLQ